MKLSTRLAEIIQCNPVIDEAESVAAAGAAELRFGFDSSESRNWAGSRRSESKKELAEFDLIKAHDVSSIVVRAPNWVGDAVMCVAALRELRRLFPNSHITVVSKPGTADIFADADYVDDVLVYERSGLKSFLESDRRVETARVRSRAALSKCIRSSGYLIHGARAAARWLRDRTAGFSAHVTRCLSPDGRTNVTRSSIT